MIDAPPPMLGRTPRPYTPVQRALQIVLGVMLFGAVPAMFLSHHFPSQLSIRVAQILAAALAVWAAWEARTDGAFDRAGAIQRSWLTRSAWARVPLMAVFAFFITFTTVEDGLLALTTAAIGQPSSQILTVTGVGHSRKQCDHFKVREAGWLLDQALCAPDEDLDRARVGDALTVFGRRSPFGVNVERYELATRPRVGSA